MHPPKRPDPQNLWATGRGGLFLDPSTVRNQICIRQIRDGHHRQRLNKLLCKHHNLNVFNSQTESISKAKQTCHSHRPATSTSQHFVVSPVGRLARRIAYSSSACKNFRSRHRPKQPKRPRRVTSVQERTSLIGSRDWPAARRDKRFAAIDLPSKCPR